MLPPDIILFMIAIFIIFAWTVVEAIRQAVRRRPHYTVRRRGGGDE